MINSLDENGYLHINKEEVTTIPYCHPQEVEQSFRIIQGLEPAGIGASNLQECLQLQIKRRMIETSLRIESYQNILFFLQKKSGNSLPKSRSNDERNSGSI